MIESNNSRFVFVRVIRVKWLKNINVKISSLFSRLAYIYIYNKKKKKPK